MRLPALIAAVLGCCALIGAGAPASAQINQFEIKEPKVEKGETEIEYRGDYGFHAPRRRFIEESPGSFAFDDNEFARQRHSLSVGYGFTKWLNLQVGFEAEQERIDEPASPAQANSLGSFKITEIEVEGTIVLVPAGKNGFAAAALFEYNAAVDRAESDQLFLGTALSYARGPWSATANLYLVKNFGGQEELEDARIKDERWDFQYAAQLKYQASKEWAFALEGYGVVERLWNTGTRSEERLLFGDFDRHLLGPVLYYSWSEPKAGKRRGDDDDKRGKKGKDLRVGKKENGKKNGDDKDDDDNEGTTYTMSAGVLFGLNENTSDVTLKWGLSVEF